MQINAKFYLDTLYIQIVGELDEHTASHARTAIDTQLDGAECKQVVIDLSKLEFMDSTGIGIMMGRYKKMKQRGIPIYIANPSVQADKILKMTALYDVMPRVKGEAT